MFPIGFLAYGGIIAAAVVALLVAWSGDRALQRSKGAQTATVKIERATDNAISKGRRAAAASADGRVLGIRDPSTVDDKGAR